MKHILIVDDDVHINQMLEEVLTSAGYKVTHAYSGTEALLLIPSIKPDLILLDLMLPGLSGEEIIDKIAHIPVIVISAKIDTKNKIALLLNGAVDYVTKPFDVDELLARIVAQLRHSQTNSINSVLEHEDIRLDLNTRKEADNLVKKEPAQYIVEREFLGKFSVEELLVRIVKSHVKKGLSRG